jgi:tetratricopeptide (TPR) repeat protein
MAFEHRMYLSLIAVMALGVAAVFSILGWAQVRWGLSAHGAARIGCGLVVALLLVFGGLTIDRNSDYCHFGDMYVDLVARRPLNFRARETLALFHYGCGDPETGLAEARRALQLGPGYYPAYNTAGLCFLQLGQLSEAVKCFTITVQAAPEAEYGNFRLNLGEALLLGGNLEKAVGELRESSILNPSQIRAKVLLANALYLSGQKDQAETTYREVMSHNPGAVKKIGEEARINVLNSKANPIVLRSAVMLAEAACRMTRGQQAEYLDTLAIAYAATGKFDQAQETCRQGIERAQASENYVLTREMKGRLELFGVGKPYNQKNAL